MASVIVDDLRSFTTWSLVVAVVSIVLIYIMIQWQKGKHFRKLADNIPGPPTFPIIGNLNLLVAGNLDQTFKLLRAQSNYGTVAKLWLGNMLLMVISDPIAAERIIANKKFLSRTKYVTQVFRPFFKNGILISDGETWKSHRRILAPHFAENIVRKYISIFHRNTMTLVDDLQRFADGSSLFDSHELAFFCTMNAAWETTTGTILRSDVSQNGDIHRNALRVIDITAERYRRPWLLIDWIFNFSSMKKENDTLTHFFYEIVRDIVEKRMEFNESVSKTNMENVTPLVDRLLMEGQMTKEDVHVEMLNILGAASETTATLYCYTLSMLGVHQDVQERLFQEQKSIFQDNPHREVSWEDLQKMTYTEQVVKEVMRLFPPATLLIRTVEEDTDVGNGLILPEGSHAMVFTYLLHRNPRYFPDPEKFDPDRFSPENSEGRHPYSYLPFSAGRRNCFGYKYGMMLVMLMLSITLRRYHVVNTVGGREAIDSSLEIGLIMKPASGFKLQIAQRSATQTDD